MFSDEPRSIPDAIKWHLMLRDFYRMNLLRPAIHEDPQLVASHRAELARHIVRLRQLRQPCDSLHAAVIEIAAQTAPVATAGPN